VDYAGGGNLGDKNFLKWVWILPNILLYLGFFFLLYFIISNFSGLKELNILWVWIAMSILILIVAIFGSIRIKQWINHGKV
jgi:ABC-type transport system involved in cytochrome c biogenesis permease subunit